MNPEYTDPIRRTTDIADRTNHLLNSVRQSLDRMDHTLTLAEAKVALVRDLMSKRRDPEHPTS